MISRDSTRPQEQSDATAASLRSIVQRLDLRLRRAVQEFRDELATRGDDAFRGLYISDQDVDALLAGTPAAEEMPHILRAPAAAILPRLAELSSIFELDAFEQEVLLICLAPEIDLRYERLFAYLQDDVSRRRPTVELIMRLLTPTVEEQVAHRSVFSPTGRLVANGLLVSADDAAEHWPLLARPLRVDERITEYLLGSDRLDPRIASFVHLFPPETDASATSLPSDLATGLVRMLTDQQTTADRGPIIYLHGSTGVARRDTARYASGRTGRPLLAVDLDTLLIAPRPAHLLGLAAREALLQKAILCLDRFDLLLGEEADITSLRHACREILAGRPGPTFLTGDARWEPAAWLPGIQGLRVEVPLLPPSGRIALWRHHLDGRLDPSEVADLATRFRLDSDTIRAVAAAAHLRARWRGSDDITLADIQTAARAIAAPPLEGLARRIEPRYNWSDIVLPADGIAQLREICARARFQGTVLDQWGFGRKHARRSGLTALFAGQPGTGKTMAAEVVAGELGYDLYRVDLSAVVSKYIGETEKNLERIFRAADHGDAVLLFDEADALFGKRSEVRDAHDRYANVEIAYLLQRLETYDGVAILTTNLRGNLDEAFVRRLDFVLEFPMPEEAERLAIWHLALPPEAPLAPDVDLPFLARKFRLAGGHIRNIALGAAFLAASANEPIGMRHLVRATRREYQKLGKLVGEGDFEGYYAFLKDDSLSGS
ncbi:MAG: ATP-binding protein [Chloroflexi bacterium]|nr:ATP-binding protein [Chloroflexota bacterium]